MAKVEMAKKSISKCENKRFMVKLLPFELSLAMSKLRNNQCQSIWIFFAISTFDITDEIIKGDFKVVVAGS